MPIREAYGLTEARARRRCSAGDASPVGTVGAPYPGRRGQLADDGEILIRGDVVFRGYFKNDEATREAIDAEGWLRTGDVARWEDGPAGRELRIIDRKKDIMITAGGKNITPSEIENALPLLPYIREAIVIADRRRFVSALIQIDFESVGKWAGGAGPVLHALPQPRRARAGARAGAARGRRGQRQDAAGAAGAASSTC